MATQRTELIPKLAALLALAVLAGCTALPAPVGGPQPRDETGRSAEVPGPETPPAPGVPSTTTEPLNGASAALLERGRTARDDGRYAEAERDIERALGISPNSALLWIELAELKAEQNDPDQAVEMARKALTLAGTDRSIRTRADRLLD